MDCAPGVIRHAFCRPMKGKLVNAINSTRALTVPVIHAHPSSPDFGRLDSLPYRDSLDLDACETAPGLARRRMRSLLGTWSLAEFSSVACLVATELITNSVTETGVAPWSAERPPVRLWTRGGPSVVAVLIWDAVTRAPAPRAAADDDESGRGLGIVAGLSSQWGFYYHGELGGKVTWAIIETP
jgi:hypothetical protein